MSKLSTLLLSTCLTLVTGVLSAVTLSPGTDPHGNACDVVSWSDAAGQTRSVWIKKSSPGGFITRYTWVNNGTPVDARLRQNYPPWGFLVLVNHWRPESTGQFVTSCDASHLTVPLTASVPFQGDHHLVWRGTFRMRIDPASAVSWYNTVQFFFADGRNDFGFSTTYDTSDMPEADNWSDMRSPYGELDWDGDGSSIETLSGIGWGSTHKFRSTTTPLGPGSAWDFSEPNSIPYIWQWKDSSLNDAELAIVQNQRYSDQAAGGGVHAGTCSGFPAPPSSGTALSNIEGPYKACIPYQMNVYANWAGQRFTWGSVFRNVWGMFGNGRSPFQDGHSDAYGLYTYADRYPVNAWSWNVLVGRHSEGGQAALVSDTESIFATSLSASLGTVQTSGPRGPGNYTAAGMPVDPYARPGFDPVHRAWRATASGGAATLSFAVSGTLRRPTLILKSMPGLPCLLSLDGAPQSHGSDYVASYDAATQEAYITFQKNLGAGTRSVAVQASCGTPTPSITPGGPSNTPSPTPSPSFTASRTPSISPTPTPLPACSELLADHLEDGNLANLLGGSWSSWAGAPATVSAPSVAGPGYAASPYGALYAVAVSGSNAGSQVGSISTSFAPAINMGARDRLIFWIRATSGGTSYRVNVARAAITDYDHYGAAFSVPAGVWTRVELPFAGMAQAGWGAPVPMAWNDVNGLTFYATAVGSFNIALDDVSFGCPGPPPTPTSTRTASPTRSATPSATPSPTSPPPGSSPTVTPSALLTPCAGDSLGGTLQSGDKIVFFGDSITYRGNFTDMVQAHLSARYPTAGFSFANAGGPGDAAMQGWSKINSVLAMAPDVVLICFGMNDAFGAGTYQTDYPNYMQQIVNSLRSNGIRVALLTPGIVDLSVAGNILPADYNTRLRWIADWTLAYASTEGLPVYDIHAAMAAADASLKAAQPGTHMIPDAVHPDPAGGWVMGLGALKALGVPDRCGEILFQPLSAAVEASAPLQAAGASGLSFDLQLNTLPSVAPAAARKVLAHTPLQAQLNGLRLRVPGLPAASYYISINGHRSGPVTAAALAAGVNLYDHWIAPASDPGQWHRVELLDAAAQPAYACDPGASDGLIDDFERAPLGQWLVNRWAGDSWGLDVGTGGSSVTPNPLVRSAPGRDGSGYCLRISGNAELSPGNPPALVTYVNGLGSDVKEGVRFWIKGLAGTQARFQIHTWYEKRQTPEYWNDYGHVFSFTGAWQQVSVPYSSLVLPSWGTPYAFNPQEAYSLVWFPYTPGAFDISLDDIEFYCIAPVGTPTPTRTASPSPSPSFSPSASPTQTPSPSASPSPSPTSTATESPTVTASPTETEYAGTPTSTFSASPTPSLSPSPSASPTWSDTATGTPTATASATATLTSTATPTRTASATPSRTSTASATATLGPASPTSTPSASPTLTSVLTSTPSATLSLTAAPSLTATPTQTVTLSPTPGPAVPTATQTAQGGTSGALEVLEVVPLPNPNPSSLRVRLAGPAEACRVRIYNKSMQRLLELQSPVNSQGGWVQVDLGDLGLPNGVYYYAVWAQRGALSSLKPQIGKLAVLR